MQSLLHDRYSQTQCTIVNSEACGCVNNCPASLSLLNVNLPGRKSPRVDMRTDVEIREACSGGLGFQNLEVPKPSTIEGFS